MTVVRVVMGVMGVMMGVMRLREGWGNGEESGLTVCMAGCDNSMKYEGCLV